MKRYVIVVLCLALIMSLASKTNAQQASVNLEHFSTNIPADASFNYGPANSGIQTISAVYANNRVNLSWAAKATTAPLEYVIQRSMDGEHFESLGTKETGTTAGEFSFSDHLPAKAMRLRDVYYRIGWRKDENSFAYTKPMLVRVAKAGAVDYISVFPHPEKNDINFQMALNEDSYMVASLTNDAGKELMTRKGKAETGKQLLALTGTGQLEKGIYWLEIRVNSKEALKLRLIKE